MDVDNPKLGLHTVSTHNTGLNSTQRFTVLPNSGSIVMRGGTAENIPWALHQYKLEGGRLQKLRQVKQPCEHRYNMDILGVLVEGEELLAVACKGCGNIKLVNMETEEHHIAYSSKNGPYTLCLGEEGRIWVCCYNDNTVRELNCTTKIFTETGRTVSTTGSCYYMLCLPAPHKALVLSHTDWLEAVSCETGQQLWRLQGEVDGSKLDPKGLTQHELLLVADKTNSRILVLNPATGSLLQTFPSPGPAPWSFGWSRGRLLLRHETLENEKVWWISHLQLVAEHQSKSLKLSYLWLMCLVCGHFFGETPFFVSFGLGGI